MDGTKIKIKPFNSEKGEIIDLHSGDLFIFRADLIHAGCAYDVDNVRLHVFLDSQYIKRIKNRTYIVE